MRCDTCNRRMNDYEATLKHAELGHYMNMCTKCLGGLGIPTVGRSELAPKTLVEDEFDDDLYDTDFERELSRTYYEDTNGES